MASRDTSERSVRVLMWHWGRRGGGPRYTLHLARALATDPTLDVHLSVSRQAELFDALASLGVPRLDVDTYRGKISAGLALGRLPAVRARFGRYLRDHGIDVVACTMPHVWNVPMLRQIHRAGARYLLTLHDATLHEGDDFRMWRWLLRREALLADGIVTLTEHVRRELETKWGVSRQRSVVIPHGVSDRNASAQPRTFPRGRGMRLLFFGRLLPYKGLELLLEAFATLRRAYRDLELVIAGSGSLVPYPSALLTAPGIQVVNRWIGEEEIDGFFRSADLVVLPYREASQSGVAVHAFEHRVPVVATPVGGLVEQVAHLRTGLIARAVSAEGIATALADLVSNPPLYEHCSEQIGHVVASHLAWPQIGAQMSRAIKQVVA